MTGVAGAEISLRPVASSVRAARHYVVEQLNAAGFAAALPIAELLVSELVTNAVLHARTQIRLRIDLTETTARFEVSDDDAGLPAVRRPGRDAVTGRGLLLVDRMSARWGVDAAPPGKVVWFELPRDPVDQPAGEWAGVWEV
jgi:anti-sigma regulatory factor (Ser/Thr protein kinase)